MIYEIPSLFISDLHAHLSFKEVVGYLGGKWDPENKILYVKTAYPGKSVSENMHIRCEMDPLTEIMVILRLL